jgi:hypothetical protein
MHARFWSRSPNVNRSIYFPAFVFLLLFALLLLLSEQFSRFSLPRSMRESGKATDRTAVEKATLINPESTTKRDLQSDLAPVLTEFRRRLSGVGLFPRPIGIKVSANHQPVDSDVDSAINKVTRRLRRVQRHLKDRLHPSFVKIVTRRRPMANLVTRIHSWLVGEFGLAYTTNGQPRKENRINGRRLKRRSRVLISRQQDSRLSGGTEVSGSARS